MNSKPCPAAILTKSRSLRVQAMDTAYTEVMKPGLQFLVSQTTPTKGDSKSINEGMEEEES